MNTNRDNDSSSSDSSGETAEMMRYAILARIGRDILSYEDRRPCYTGSMSGYEYIQELLTGHLTRIYDQFRMDKYVFLRLCYALEEHQLLENSRSVTIQEAVGMTLMIIGHSSRIRAVCERFQRGKNTVMRHFHDVLRAICSLAPTLIQPPNQTTTPSQIVDNPKYFPYFQNCIGAIDGTHVAAWSPPQKQTAYRGRKSVVSQNVMCCYDFDMMFTFVYARWEGTANDSRIFLDAVSRSEAGFPLPRQGRYYVVDSGYANMPGFLTPYRGERYHLRDYRGPDRTPRGPQELFNYRHSSLRNVIERCFVVLKKRFAILKYISNYSPRYQRLIPVACCALHNFIRRESRGDSLFQDFQREDALVEGEDHKAEEHATIDINMSQAGHAEMNALRDQIAAELWRDFTNAN